jgi:hypothetical protein
LDVHLLAADDTGRAVGTALPFPGLLPLFILFVVWLISAIAAAVIASNRDRSGTGRLFATFCFLGPLGVGFALIALHGQMDRLPPPAPKRPVADGRWRFACVQRATFPAQTPVMTAGDAVSTELSGRRRSHG